MTAFHALSTEEETINALGTDGSSDNYTVFTAIFAIKREAIIQDYQKKINQIDAQIADLTAREKEDQSELKAHLFRLNLHFGFFIWAVLTGQIYVFSFLAKFCVYLLIC